MALTANTIPSQVPLYATPYDAMNAFASAQTLTATGYMTNTLDVGGAQPSSGAGRTEGMWVLDITNLKVSATDESYRFHLFGSNDVAFGNGNVELLAMHDFAALAANRIVATILGATPTIPPTGMGGVVLQIPFTNLMQRIVYRYLRVYAVIAGTSPTVTLSSWLSKSGVDV